MTSLWCPSVKKDTAFYSDAFDDMLLNDAVPFVEKHFRVKSERKYRAIAGLSMGSFTALLTAARHLGVFGSIGVFSGAVTMGKYCQNGYDRDFSDPAAFNGSTDLLFIAHGEDEDKMPVSLDPLCERFRESGIPFEKYTTPGHHEWTVWRRCVSEFCRRLFKK